MLEPNYDKSKSKALIPGTTFTKDPYIKSVSNTDSYCFVRVEIPTTTYTTSDGTDVIGDAVKMLYNGKEGINASDWKTVKEYPSAEVGKNSVYIFEYIRNAGILSKNSATGKLFDSMTMPKTVAVSKTTKTVTSAAKVDGAVSIQGYLVSTKDAKSINDAYAAIQDAIEEEGDTEPESSNSGNKLQEKIDDLNTEKEQLETQITTLETKLINSLSTGDAKASEVIKGKIFSNAEATDIVGTMPTYDKGYYGTGDPSTTYTWTNIEGKAITENKEGYQSKIESGTGLKKKFGWNHHDQ